MLERGWELARLAELVDATRTDGAVALIEGPPGIGKTELLRALAALAGQAGFDVLRATGAELEQGFSFGVARQLLEHTITKASVAERRQALAGAASLASPVVATSEWRESEEETSDPFLIAHGLYWLCANLSDRAPLAILVDDAHWADRPSLLWMHYLSRRLEGLPVLLALTARSTMPEAPVEMIEAIKADGSPLVLRPEPLSESAGAELLREQIRTDPAADLVREAHRVTGGNPFMIRELGRSLVEDGLAPDASAAERMREVTPQTITHSTLGRLARMPAPDRELARAVAVLDEDAELRHAAALAGLAQGEAHRSADRLVAAGFLASLPDAVPKLRFSHPLIRQALYADLPGGERARRHKKAARLLAAEGGSPERAAAHLMAATPAGDGWAADVLMEAAEAATATGAPEIAVSYLRRALDEPPPPAVRGDVLLRLGQAEAQALNPDAISHLEAATSTVSEPFERLAALGTLAFTKHVQGRDEESCRIAREALAQITPGEGGEIEAWLLGIVWIGRPVPELVDDVTSVLGLARTTGSGETTAAELMRLSLVSMDLLLRGKRGLAVETLAAMDSAPAELIASELAPIALTLGFTQAYAGRESDAEKTLLEGLGRERRRGTKLLMSSYLDGLTYLRWRKGDLSGSLAESQTTLDLFSGPGEGEWDPMTMWARVWRSLCHTERGDLDAARAELDIPEELEARLPATWWWVWLPYGRGRLALAEADWSEARRQALEAGERLAAIQAPSPDYMPWRSLAARAVAMEGRRDEALELALQELELARAEGSRRSIGMALTTYGSIEGAEKGLEALAEAASVLEGMPDRLEHARALCELGAVLRRANRRVNARTPLEQAVEEARKCGAVPLAERAHGELRATGARPRSLVFSGVESLTARERQVADLASAGRSNPEIAQALFLTRKTVETHLGSVYRKLGIGSRDLLAEKLGEAP